METQNLEKYVTAKNAKHALAAQKAIIKLEADNPVAAGEILAEALKIPGFRQTAAFNYANGKYHETVAKDAQERNKKHLHEMAKNSYSQAIK